MWYVICLFFGLVGRFEGVGGVIDNLVLCGNLCLEFELYRLVFFWCRWVVCWWRFLFIYIICFIKNLVVVLYIYVSKLDVYWFRILIVGLIIVRVIKIEVIGKIEIYEKVFKF